MRLIKLVIANYNKYMHCNYPKKVYTLTRNHIFIMFVYIHSTHVMTICNRFDICSSGKVKAGEGYPNKVAIFGAK